MQTSGSEDAKSVYHRHRRRQCRRENDLCAAASDGAGGHRRSAAFYGRLFQAGSRATVGGRKHGAALPGRQLPGGVRSAASAAGLLLVGGPFLLAAVLIKRDGFAIGGGDMKLMGACGFVLGVGGGLLQSILSLLLIVLAGAGTAVRRKCKLNNVKMPLAPFFCAGGVFAYAAVAAASI